MATKVENICDICGKKASILKKTIQVAFWTEQNEGRNTKPYLDLVQLDLCQNCLDNIIDSHPVEASGAQGHNSYKLASHASKPTHTQTAPADQLGEKSGL